VHNFPISLNLPCNISHSNAGLKSEIYYIKKTKQLKKQSKNIRISLLKCNNLRKKIKVLEKVSKVKLNITW
jgi:hypothetical protein